MSQKQADPVRKGLIKCCRCNVASGCLREILCDLRFVCDTCATSSLSYFPSTERKELCNEPISCSADTCKQRYGVQLYMDSAMSIKCAECYNMCAHCDRFSYSSLDPWCTFLYTTGDKNMGICSECKCCRSCCACYMCIFGHRLFGLSMTDAYDLLEVCNRCSRRIRLYTSCSNRTHPLFLCTECAALCLACNTPSLRTQLPAEMLNLATRHPVYTQTRDRCDKDGCSDKIKEVVASDMSNGYMPLASIVLEFLDNDA
jgi:hypothetical protein